MSTEGTIVINGVDFGYKFGMKQTRLYMQAHNLTQVDEYFKKVSEIGTQTIEGYSILSGLVRSAINAVGGKGLPKDSDDLLDALFQSGEYENVLAAFTASMPKMKSNPDPSGK